MSLQYDAYLKEHISNVYNGYLWIMGNISDEKLDEVLPTINREEMMIEMKIHDRSKYRDCEYKAYDAYFYGPDGIANGGEATEEVQRDFDFAWLSHIHLNPHHWQHWVLIEDEPDSIGEKGKPLDIPDNCIIEMICDWWSFSWKTGDLHEIFNWWDAHKDRVVMTEVTKEKVEKLLELIREALVEYEEKMREIEEMSGSMNVGVVDVT